MEKKVTTHIVKGLIIGLVIFALSTILQVFNIQDKWVQWAILALFMAAIVWADISFSNDMDSNVTYGKVFVHGFKTTTIVTLISIAGFLLIYLIMPEIKDKALLIARTEMEKDPKNTEDMIDTAMKMVDKFFLAFGIGGTLLSYMFFGAIASLIGAAIAKKNPQTGMPQNM